MGEGQGEGRRKKEKRRGEEGEVGRKEDEKRRREDERRTEKGKRKGGIEVRVWERRGKCLIAPVYMIKMHNISLPLHVQYH